MFRKKDHTDSAGLLRVIVQNRHAYLWSIAWKRQYHSNNCINRWGIIGHLSAMWTHTHFSWLYKWLSLIGALPCGSIKEVQWVSHTAKLSMQKSKKQNMGNSYTSQYTDQVACSIFPLMHRQPITDREQSGHRVLKDNLWWYAQTYSAHPVCSDIVYRVLSIFL